MQGEMPLLHIAEVINVMVLHNNNRNYTIVARMLLVGIAIAIVAQKGKGQ